jgi:hypothetical protein
LDADVIVMIIKAGRTASAFQYSIRWRSTDYLEVNWILSRRRLFAGFHELAQTASLGHSEAAALSHLG